MEEKNEIATSELVKMLKAQCSDICETADVLRGRGLEVMFLGGFLVGQKLTVKVSEVL